MDSRQILDMIASSSSWEQIVYEVVGFEGLDPWDVDLTKLADGFLTFIGGMKTLDFRIPATYVMVAASLLRLKSDHMPLLDFFHEDGDVEIEAGGAAEPVECPLLSPLTIPPRRIPRRRVVVSELVEALRKAMGTAERRESRLKQARGKIRIKEDDMVKRISSLYERIAVILTSAKKQEVAFTSIVPKWDRPEVAGTFVPLVFLDQQKKVACRQEDMFEEIYVKRGRDAVAAVRQTPSAREKIVRRAMTGKQRKRIKRRRKK